MSNPSDLAGPKTLDFEPVVRKVQRPDGWTPELQRELIARIAAAGTLQQAVWQMGKHATGAEALYKTPAAVTFRACWDAAIIIGRRRNGLDAARPVVIDVPGITRRRAVGRPVTPLPGQVLNESGEWEDKASLDRRAEDARDRIANKLLNARRLYLHEISASPGKRAAFEILTGYLIDWEKAANMEPQDDGPWRKPNMRAPDMILTAENGWFGEVGYGEDKKAELQRAVDQHRAEMGLPPIDWSESTESESTERSDADAEHRRSSAKTEHRRSAGGRPRSEREASPDGGARDLSRANPSDESCGFTPHDRSSPSPNPTPPQPRTLSLNTPEAYEALTEPRPDAWRGDLPIPPREWDAEPVPKTGPAPRKGKK